MNWIPAIVGWLLITMIALYFGARMAALCWTLACVATVLDEYHSRWAKPAWRLLFITVVIALATY